STRRITAALPVLTRGPQDSGFTADSSVLSPFPTLDAVTPPNRQPAAKLGDTLTLTGRNLSGGPVAIQFTSTRLAQPIPLSPEPEESDSKLTVLVPNEPAQFPAGMYTVAAVVKSDKEGDRVSNELALAIAPVITSDMPMRPRRGRGRQITLNLTCAPEVRPDQRVALLLGSREIPAAPRTEQTAQLTFVV